MVVAAGVAACGGSSATVGAPPKTSPPVTSPGVTSSPHARPSTSPNASRGTSTARATAPAAGHPLAAFYQQKLSWHSCSDGFECTTLVVPLDYTAPTARRLHIAVIRKQSTGTHHGSLILNPGGPGASGVQFLEEAAKSFSELNHNFDLVSFDPRGVGASDPIRCLTSAQIDAYVNANPDPTTGAGVSHLIAMSRQFADDCYQRNGNYLEHVGTIDEARDMDVLRAALGDHKLTYYGASYGTYLGTKYAQLFPHRIRAMVLDGALNPDESVTNENRIQALGFETDLRDFLHACVASHSCPFGSSYSAALAYLNALIARITAHPLAVGARSLGPGLLFEGLAAGLYSPGNWGNLWQVLAAAKDGNGAGVLLFADSLTERNNDGSYSNLIESNMAINCVDRPAPTSSATYIANARAFAKQAPHFGAAIELGSMPCAFWKVPAVEPLHTVAARGAPPILVIGTTRDPATPYVWAKALAHQLSSGVLLTYDSDGHTAYIRHNSCVDAAVLSYLVDLRAPNPGTTCR